MTKVEEAKRIAAERAIDFVRSHTAIGLGTGSTMRYALEELARRLASGMLQSVVGVPTSEQTAHLSRKLGIPLTDLAAHPRLDLAIDGADEIDPRLDLIKGLGGALLREKIVAAAAADVLIVADDSKLVPRLGSLAPLPLEVVPFGVPYVLRELERWPGRVRQRLTDGGHPFTTDEGNHILDYYSGPIADPEALDRTLHGLPGLVDHGLFLGLARRAIVSSAGGLRLLERGQV